MAVTKTPIASASGLSVFTDTDNAGAVVSVSSTSTVIYSIDVDNTANAAATYVKLWNAASGSVTIGTTAPDKILLIPPSTRVCFPIPQGVTFGTAVTVASVTTAGTAGSTGPTSDVIVRITYV